MHIDLDRQMQSWTCGGGIGKGGFPSGGSECRDDRIAGGGGAAEDADALAAGAVAL